MIAKSTRMRELRNPLRGGDAIGTDRRPRPLSETRV